MSYAVPECAFAAVLFLLVVFRFALAERKTKYRYNGSTLLPQAELLLRRRLRTSCNYAERSILSRLRILT